MGKSSREYSICVGFAFLVLLFSTISISFAQYELNGNAVKLDCSCYELTKEVTFQSGSVWNKTKIDLRENFEFQFSANFGKLDAEGADGIAFILQPISSNLGAAGGGMGFSGIKPSLGVLMDTWQNSDEFDPAYDHIGLHYNGNTSHSLNDPSYLDGKGFNGGPLVSNLSDPYFVQANKNNPNIEDNADHDVRIKWDAATKTLSVFFDGQYRIGYSGDIVKNIFGNDPMVYWGISSATGGSVNKHSFCTQLEAKVKTPQSVCVGNEVTISNESVTFNGGAKTWAWDFGDGSTVVQSMKLKSDIKHTYANPGTYTIKLAIEDYGGCTSDFSTSIVVNPAPSAPTAGSNSPICEGSTLNLTSTTVGSATYSWTGPGGYTSAAEDPTRANATTAMSGTYSVTVTVAGCTSPAGTVAVTVNPIPSAPTVGSNSPICEGSTLNLTSSTVGSATYSWTGPGGYTSAVEDPTRANATTAMSGTYSVTVTVAGCTSPAGTVVVTVNPIPSAPTAGSNSPICEGATLNLTSTTVGSATYAWTGPGGYTSAAEDPTRANATTAMSGTYSVTVTLAGCTSPAGTVAVTVNPIPAASTTGSNSPICEGATLNLTSTTIGSATYAWTGPGGYTSAVEDPTRANATTAMSGTYSVTVTVAGCTSTAGTVAVTVNPIPSAPTAGSNSPICEGSTLNLTSNTVGSATYAWTGPGGYTSAVEDPTRANATTAMSGTYSVTVTVAGCTSPAGTVAVTVNPIPSAPTAGSNSPICEGSTLNLTSNTVGSATYSWTGPGGYTSAVEDPTRANATTAMSGTYSVTVTVAGCTSTAGTVAVTVNPIPAAPTAGSNSPICEGSTLNLTSTTVGSATYSWTGPGGYTSAVEDPTRANATTVMSGTYSVTVTVAGCTSATSVISVIVHPKPIPPVIVSSPTCVGDYFEAKSKNQHETYLWSGPNAFTATTDKIVFNSVQLQNEGKYTLQVFDKGCASELAEMILILNTRPLAPILAGDTLLCVGTMAMVNVTYPQGQRPASEHYWLLNGEVVNHSNSYANMMLPAGDFVISVYGKNNGCVGPTSTLTIHVDKLDVRATISDTIIRQGSSVQLSVAELTNQQASYEWTKSESSQIQSLQERWMDTPTQSTEYKVIATKGKCTDTDVVSVRVLHDIVLYNVFTPNSDVNGLNERWVIDYIEEYPQAEVKIFNRWGTLVFQDKQGYKTPWKGENNDIELPTAVYYYVVEDHAPISPKTFSGSVTIIR